MNWFVEMGVKPCSFNLLDRLVWSNMSILTKAYIKELRNQQIQLDKDIENNIEKSYTYITSKQLVEDLLQTVEYLYEKFEFNCGN